MELGTQCVFVANGEIQAKQVQAFLEAAGIATAVRGESLRHTHGLTTLNGLGNVEVHVAETDVEQARALLDAAEMGQLRLDDEFESDEVGE